MFIAGIIEPAAIAALTPGTLAMRLTRLPGAEITSAPEGKTVIPVFAELPGEKLAAPNEGAGNRLPGVTETLGATA